MARAGRVAVLIGANGSGKSNVMRFFQMLGWMLLICWHVGPILPGFDRFVLEQRYGVRSRCGWRRHKGSHGPGSLGAGGRRGGARYCGDSITATGGVAQARGRARVVVAR